MNIFRPALSLVRAMWFAIDAGNSVRHGKPVSDKAQRYCMTEQARQYRAVA